MDNREQVHVVDVKTQEELEVLLCYRLFVLCCVVMGGCD